MANAKTEAAEAAKTEAVKIEKPYDPWKDIVTVMIPKEATGDRSHFVGVNGKTYQIPKGKAVRVPRPVADVLARRERSMQIADAYMQAQIELSNQVQGAPNNG